jgi:hypothetical protein
MKRLLTAVAVLCILAGTAVAMPFGDTIPLPNNAVGNSRCHPLNANYTIVYDSEFGGHWNLSGRRSLNKDGTYTDSFRGTVSDTSIQNTFTRNDFEWLSDSYWLCGHVYKACSSFSMTISNGNVTGFATYTP